MRLGAAALAASLVLVLSTELQASPCCMSATNGGLGRLKPWESAAVGIQQSLAESLGRWTSEADWQSFDDYSEREWRTTATGMFALSPRASLFAAAPVVITERSSQQLSGTGGGIGDVQFGARYQWLDFGELPNVPAVAIFASMTAPTGRAPDAAQGTLASDATGRGAWIPEVGAELELARSDWFLRLGVSGAFPLPMTRADTGASQRFGPAASAHVLGGRALVDEFVLSVSARGLAAAPLEVDSASVPASEQLDLGLGVQLSWILDPHWTLLADADTGVFVNGLGRNVPGRLVFGAGIRRAFF